MLTSLLKVALGLAATGAGIALLAMLAAVSAHHNPYDAMDTRCGRGLVEICRSTGVNWSR